MEIKGDMRNELMKRQEIEIIIESEKNPSFENARNIIAEKFSKLNENIDVFNIIGGFGKRKFKIKAHIYDSKQDLDIIKKLQLTRKKKKELMKQTEEGNAK